MTPAPLRRRTSLAALAAVAALVLTACGGGVSDAAGPSSAAPAATFHPATSGDLHLYTWSDYFPPDLVKKFKADTGINLTVDYYDSNETLEAKLKATDGAGYDVVVPSDYMVQALVSEGLLREFDAAALPNGKNIEKSFLDVYFDPGRKYSIPYLYGTTGFAYDSSAVTGADAPKTWKDYFNPPASAGKVGVFADQVDVINAALRAVGGEPCTTDGVKLQAAQDLLLNFKKSVGTISSDAIIDRLTSGEQKMAMTWNGAAHRVIVKKPSVTYVYPTEGVTLWQDNFTIPKGAENVDQAMTFMNWMLDPANAAAAANFQGYNAGITGVDALLDEAMKKDPAVVMPAGTKAAPVKPCDAAEQNNYSKIWEKFNN